MKRRANFKANYLASLKGPVSPLSQGFPGLSLASSFAKEMGNFVNFFTKPICMIYLRFLHSAIKRVFLAIFFS
jgi:hypothetical protein